MNTRHLLICTILFFVSAHSILAQQFLQKTLEHDGNSRTYSVYLPANYQGTSELPLLFNFHGGSGDIASQVAIADMRTIADTARFILVYPQAFPDPNDGGSTNWTHKAPATIDDVFFVEAMIDTLAADYLIDQDRVYACGYSNGGEFAFELACRLSDRIAAIGSVARSMFIETFNDCAPSHPTAVVSIHGSKDDYEGITFGGITYYLSLDDINAYWANYNATDSVPSLVQVTDRNQTDGSTVEHYTWKNGNACVAVEHFKVVGGGHDWPGSFGNMDIDASMEIWNFVSKYDRNGLIACQTTSVEQELNKNNDLLIYPNPVKDVLTIEMEVKTNQTYHIYSILGQGVLSGTIDAKHQTIDVSDLPANVYFLKLNDQVLKFLK